MSNKRFKFNGIKLTLKLQSEEIKNFYKFFSSLDLTITSENKHLKLVSYRLKHFQNLNDKYLNLQKTGIDIVSIKLSNTYDLTLTFKNIIHLFDFYEDGYTKKEKEVISKYKEVYSNKSLIEKRMNIVNKVFTYIKSCRFEDRTKIKKIYFCLKLDSFQYKDYHLLKLNTQVKKLGLFETYTFIENKRNLTYKVNKYESKVNNPVFLINSLTNIGRRLPPKMNLIPNQMTNTHSQTNISNYAIDLNDTDEIKFRLENIVSNVKEFKNLTVVCNKKSKMFFFESNQYLKELNYKRNTFKFYPKIDNDSSYFDLSHIPSKQFIIYSSKSSRNNFLIKTREKYEVNLIISRWTTKDKKYLLKDEKKHDFTLADNIDDIFAQIESYTNKYQLIQVSEDNMAKIKDKNLTTRKKLEKELLANEVESVDIFDERLKSLLLKLLKNKIYTL